MIFDDLWARRAELWIDDHVRVMIPALADLRRTKRFAARRTSPTSACWTF
ncbi:MAG: hypothetical protein IPN17_13820 [Deltaproteobacteria bacterium]|nr:hypothetical protein [Deltaproteobacteria bacterium]